jgi:3',5'-cyclic AMP phosphodiesterase CpdA
MVRRPFRTFAVALGLTIVVGSSAVLLRSHSRAQFAFTSDAHYGLRRAAFRGHTNVSAQLVNEALIAGLNSLPATRFPDDGGIDAGRLVGPLDFLVEGGDIANRAERTDAGAIQPAAVSWSQFAEDYLRRLNLPGRAGVKAPVYIVPGNHDVSSAVGFYKPMAPAIDKTAMIEIYNRMMSPPIRVTTSTYTYARDAVHYSHDLDGVHFMFLNVWPDSTSRDWMAHDLASLPAETPVLLFVHDQPDVEAKHFVNPNGAHDINATDKFENLLADELADGRTIAAPTLKEQADFEAFLRTHPNVTAYFHGNSNWNEFYEWQGPRHAVTLHTFRVDSPMKGAVSATDETQLSFQVATIDSASLRMTVRECFWNAHPDDARHTLTCGAATTVSLAPRRSPT